MMLLGLDPGGTTGYAYVERDGDLIRTIETGEVKADKFHAWVKEIDGVDIFVCEDFIKRPDIGNNQWMIMDTSEKIGSLKQKAFDLGSVFVKSQPSNKEAGYRAFGGKYIKGKRGMHQYDALAHAWLVAKHGFKPSMKEF